MAFAAAMGVDFAISGITMAAALAPVEEKPVARIGIGSTQLGAKEDARTNGIMPNLHLYDVRGKRFAKHESGDLIEDGANVKKDFMILDGAEKSAEPEYLTIQARSNDATCVTYVTVTGASGAQRTWHAGYVKTCQEQGGGGFYYPSPNTVPDTNFRPGCVWLSNDDRFMQAISVHLPSFGFPEESLAEQTAKQFKDYPQTLCQAPGRMSLYKTFDGEQPECIPYYDKILEKFKEDEVSEEKGINEGFDKDFQAVLDGHTLPPRRFFFKPSRKAISFERTCDYSKHKLFNQEMQPGKTPVKDSPQAQKEKEAAEAKQKADAAAAARAAAEEQARKDAEAALSEQGRNPNGAAPGTGSFGGVAGLIPADQAGKPVDPDEAAKNLEEFKEQQKASPTPAAPAPAPEPTGQPAPDVIIEIKRRGSRSLHQGQQDEETKATREMLTRREQLRVKGDYCVDRLTISHHAEHSAREVCEMKNSWGPDFVSVVEGLYCDMCERELYPLCAHEHQTDCFDVDDKVLRGKESLWQRVKRYVTVDVWRV
ncbi:hypothetical protein HBI57_075700 [Parastagonospora nodorum]|nr:hypothetical protein HBI57_075700 [Parastagonospora nodorum]KAH6475244.1 hypothetical protein HBI58_123250 [Parastagonospora nodorum]